LSLIVGIAFKFTSLQYVVLGHSNRRLAMATNQFKKLFLTVEGCI